MTTVDIQSGDRGQTVVNLKSDGRDHKVDLRVGERIREQRNRLRMTQTALGQKLGITFQQVQKYETGKNSVAASRLPRLCKVLKITPNQLFENL